MSYSFLRKLTKDVKKEELQEGLRLLCKQKIEIYQKEKSGSYCCITDADMAAEGCLYVAAVDLEYARNLLKAAGEERLLCEETAENEENEEIQVPEAEKSLVELAQEEYDRKRRMGMVECLLIIAAAGVYFVWKNWFA